MHVLEECNVLGGDDWHPGNPWDSGTRHDEPFQRYFRLELSAATLAVSKHEQFVIAREKKRIGDRCAIAIFTSVTELQLSDKLGHRKQPGLPAPPGNPSLFELYQDMQVLFVNDGIALMSHTLSPSGELENRMGTWTPSPWKRAA
jgi:hypothetical protein